MSKRTLDKIDRDIEEVFDKIAHCRKRIEVALLPKPESVEIFRILIQIKSSEYQSALQNFNHLSDAYMKLQLEAIKTILEWPSVQMVRKKALDELQSLAEILRNEEESKVLKSYSLSTQATSLPPPSSLTKLDELQLLAETLRNEEKSPVSKSSRLPTQAIRLPSQSSLTEVSVFKQKRKLEKNERDNKPSKRDRRYHRTENHSMKTI